METTIMGLYGVQGLRIWGIYWDNGKEKGNYYSIIGYILGILIGIVEKKKETTTMDLN